MNQEQTIDIGSNWQLKFLLSLFQKFHTEVFCQCFKTIKMIKYDSKQTGNQKEVKEDWT